MRSSGRRLISRTRVGVSTFSHQIDQRGAAAQEAHIGALLRRRGLRGRCNGCGLICWTDVLVSMHREHLLRYADVRTCCMAATMLA